MKIEIIIPTSIRKPTDAEMALVHPDHLPTHYRKTDTSSGVEVLHPAAESAEGR